MVEKRHAAVIPPLEFRAPAGRPAGIEVLSLARLRTRVEGAHLEVPRRPAFHHLLALTAGKLRHTVDFTAHTVEAGTWLWIRPGQVQQWGDVRRAEGALILFEPEFPDPATAAAARLDDPHAAVAHVPAPADRDALAVAATELARAFESPGGWPADVAKAVLRHQLAIILLRLAHLGSAAGPGPGEPFAGFRGAVESEYARTRRVADYARRLGYSSRTLSRATRAAAGVTAKEFIDRRVVLEAKRLLAHSDLTAAQIAARLGFTSPANFGKYFHQRTGTTPIAFRGGRGPAR